MPRIGPANERWWVTAAISASVAITQTKNPPGTATGWRPRPDQVQVPAQRARPSRPSSASTSMRPSLGAPRAAHDGPPAARPWRRSPSNRATGRVGVARYNVSVLRDAAPRQPAVGIRRHLAGLDRAGIVEHRHQDGHAHGGEEQEADEVRQTAPPEVDQPIIANGQEVETDPPPARLRGGAAGAKSPLAVYPCPTQMVPLVTIREGGDDVAAQLTERVATEQVVYSVTPISSTNSAGTQPTARRR